MFITISLIIIIIIIITISTIIINLILKGGAHLGVPSAHRREPGHGGPLS